MGIPRWKLYTFVGLAAAVLVLAGLRVAGTGHDRPLPAPGEIGRAVERTLAEQGDRISGGRVWKPRLPGGATERTEHRVFVPREFDSIEFNHRLSKRVSPLGAHVVATERSRESTVTMHVVAAGRTLYSLSLVTDPHFHNKENAH